MAEATDATQDSPEGKMQRAILHLADSLISTGQASSAEAAAGAIHAVYALGRSQPLSAFLTFEWMRRAIDLMEAEIEDRERLRVLE